MFICRSSRILQNQIMANEIVSTTRFIQYSIVKKKRIFHGISGGIIRV
ncbi:hypothetical protein Plhal304r1_c037g0112591 [Plasmopara halstedii]